MPKSNRHNETQSIADLLKIVIDENKLSTGLNNLKLKEIWKEQMGEGVNNYTEKIKLQGNTLIVQLNSSVLREELSYGKEKIMMMINNAMGEELIKKVKLV